MKVPLRLSLTSPRPSAVIDEAPPTPACWRRSVPFVKDVAGTKFQSAISTDGRRRVLTCLPGGGWSLGRLAQDEILEEDAPLLAGGGAN